MRAGPLEPLAEFYNSAGFSDEYSYVFMARDLEPCESEAHSIEEQHMTIERVRLHDVPAMIRRGELVDAKTLIGLTLAREALKG
jgi:ADP-ribose pyrophosphatase